MGKNKKLLYTSILLFLSLGVTFFINRGMFSAFLMLFLLMGGVFWILNHYKKLTKTLSFILCLSFLIHFFLVIFIYYTDFRPFGGGADYEGYQLVAEQTAQQFLKGDFSWKNLNHYGHDFPIIIGAIYYIFGSDHLVGIFFEVWIFVMAVLFAYFIVIELGGSEKKFFYIGLFMNFYPSYAYFGSLLLKDGLVVSLALLGVLLVTKMVKKFSWNWFLLFFAVTIGVSDLRFYVGYALILGFIVSWFISSSLEFKERFYFGLALVFLIGFSPFLAGQGYFGYNALLGPGGGFLNQNKITEFREVVYNPAVFPEQTTPSPASSEIISPFNAGKISPLPTSILNGKDNPLNGRGSSFVVETGFQQGLIKFIENSLQSFAHTLLGPFVWQLRYGRQLSSLIETIPWYIFICIFIYFLGGLLKKEKLAGFWMYLKKTAPLWSFSIFALGALSLFINNYGIIARIRMPMFICLIIMMSLIIKKEYKYTKHIINRSVEMTK